MLKINKNIEIQMLNSCNVGSFEDLKTLNISASMVVPSIHRHYIYYDLENNGPFLVEEFEGKNLISRDRHIIYERDMVCHCIIRNTEDDEFLYNGTDMIHLFEHYRCKQCGKEYSIETDKYSDIPIA